MGPSLRALGAVGCAGSGDTGHRWIGLNWATGKGEKAETGPGALQLTPCSTLREAN